ncbi:MAG: flippase-like domain-containing protein [Anaerolineae bacterium]|nr:flippase-like domain-containing protein [Anaerolineae bacterium]
MKRTTLTARSVWQVARLLIGVALVVLLIPVLLTPDFWQTLAAVDKPLALLAFVLSVVSVASKAWRWGMVMRWRGIPLRPAYLFGSYLVGMFFNHFLPSGLGGDVVRAYETARDTGRGAESVTGVLVERGSGMLAVFAAGSLGALLTPGIPVGVALLAHGLFVGALLAIWALWLDLTGRALDGIGQRLPAGVRTAWGKLGAVYHEFRRYRREWRILGAIMVQSLVTLALTLASVYALVLAFGQHIPFSSFAAFFSIATAIDVIPFSLNGLGVREGVFVFFLGLLGVGAAPALGVALMIRLIVLVQAFGGGLIFLAREVRQRRRAGHEGTGVR